MKVCINTSILFVSIVPEDKKVYNFFKIFLIYYLDYLEFYRKEKKISYFTLFNEKTKLFIFWFIPSLLKLPKNQKPYPFTSLDILKIILKKYLFHPALYIGILIIVTKIIINQFKKE